MNCVNDKKWKTINPKIFLLKEKTLIFSKHSSKIYFLQYLLNLFLHLILIFLLFSILHYFQLSLIPQVIEFLQLPINITFLYHKRILLLLFLNLLFDPSAFHLLLEMFHLLYFAVDLVLKGFDVLLLWWRWR